MTLPTLRGRAGRRAALTAITLAGLVPLVLPAGAWAATDSPSIDGLTSAQKAFIADNSVLERFHLTPEKIENILAAKSPDAARAAVSAMMRTIEADRFQPPKGPAEPGRSALDPDGDMAAVELNTTAGDFNASTVLRPPALDATQRAPGPFSLKRYMYETDSIPTFAGAPFALRKEDLIAGKADVAFVGVPIDFSSGWRDAKNSTAVLRAMYGLGDYDVYAGVNPGTLLNIVDYGNFAVDRMSVELSINHVRKMVGEMVEAKVVPFIVGGDHSTLIPAVEAMADKYGAGSVGLVQIDAHNNVARDQAHFYSDEQAVSRLVTEGSVKGGSVVQIGTRGPGLDTSDFEWMKDQGIHYHTMAQVETNGWQNVVDTTLHEIEGGPQNIFVSFDISALDPSYASGAGRPASNGLTMREAVPLVRRICAETKVVGFAMLDVAPYLDLSYATALNANQIMNACLTGVAMRKIGVKGTNYHSPLTVGMAATH
ncbi:agmatinase family protein [Komagataeibacter europaeus]|uniref:agmatinase family protein n=1 Tax=Komagataeibacter europaeus TaxID=33995 RepID=UPI0015F9BDD4|nr:agmatinase family protein [Komagataeibacter europaeus]